MFNSPMVAGRTQPTTDVPGSAFMSAAPIQTISHQAAGIDLGCSNCSTAMQSLKDATASALNIPTWAKVLSVLTFFALVTSILALASRKRAH